MDEKNSEENPSTNSRRFGDYITKQLLAETASTRSWLGEQASVGRTVLIEELKPEAIQERDQFVADVRAKASVEHPIVGSIYEASTESGLCFFAHELLPGDTLEAYKHAGRKIKAQTLVHILKRISEANIYHESRNNATTQLDLDAIHVDEHGVVRIKNLAIVGDRLSEHSQRDVMNFGRELEELLDRTQPGTTRCLTLFSWMRGEDVANPLKWEEVRGYCELIEQQLTEPVQVSVPTTAIHSEKRSGFVWIAAILLVGIIASISIFSKNKKPAVVKTEKPSPVHIAAGTYTSPEGLAFDVEAFELAAHEVTIGEYMEFLETLDLLSADNEEKTFDHPDQPADKPNHIPDDWKALSAAAKNGTKWNDRTIHPDMPVVGVDWWDAYAYTKWKRSTLPTRERWQAALMAGTEKPSSISVSEWVPVTNETPDRTSNGLTGMAGSVAEWTLEPRPSPSNPLGAPLWIIAGGSYLKPAKGAATLEWVEDRSLRRPDLGFRLCKDAN